MPQKYKVLEGRKPIAPPQSEGGSGAIPAAGSPPLVARTDDGGEFHDPWRVYALAEDAECLVMCLDAAGVPKEENGNGLSLWGRVQRYAKMVGNTDGQRAGE